MNKPVLILMTRWPAIGRCKKRLSKDIGLINAASIQYKLTKHAIEVCKYIEMKELAEVKVSITGISRKASYRWLKSEGIKEITFQGIGTLGLRMKKQILLAQGNIKNKHHKGRSTIIIGTDLPSLSHVELIEALESLKKNDLVIGPATDGGYWLIGLSKNLVSPLVTWPFAGIPWGTSNVLNETIKAAKDKYVSYQLIRNQNDIDRINDLKPWQA